MSRHDETPDKMPDTALDATPKPRRRRRAHSDVPTAVAALADFVRALEQMTPTAQRAAINWLTDRYLRGGKP